MRKTVVAIALAITSAGVAANAADEKADPRALEYCKATSGTFVSVAECLPNAHVSIKTMDTFERLYPPAAQPLRTKCAERNEGNIIAAATCVTEAVRAAIDLKDALPTGSHLDDPVFEAVSDPELREQLNEAESAAQATFPKVRVWGGSMYREYK
jgi:hypothetical protein